MKQKILYILLFICAWIVSLGAGAQTTCYVVNDAKERSWSTIDNSGNYDLSGPGVTLTFEARRQTGGINNFYVAFSKDNGNSWEEKSQDLTTSYKTYTYTIDASVTTIRFLTKVGATLRKYVRNVKVTRATTLSSTTSSIDFGKTTPTVSVVKTISVAYNNTNNPTDLSGSCSNSTNSNFSVETKSLGETGTADIKVSYNPQSVGEHSEKITLTMGTASYEFEVSGRSVLDYGFSASAYTNDEAFGSVQVSLDEETGTSVSTSEESSEASVSKEAVFAAKPFDGYIFAGWFSDEGLTQRVSIEEEYSVTLTATPDNTAPAQTLYAKFEAKNDKKENAIIWKESPVVSTDVLMPVDLSDYATSQAGVPVSYSSSDPAIATVEGMILVPHAVGSIRILATAEENEEYNEAVGELAFEITKVSTQIVWNQDIPVLNDHDTEGVQLVAMLSDVRGNSIDGVKYSVTSGDAVEIADGKMYVRKKGSATITASYAGNDIYAAADDVTKDVSVTGYSVSSAWVNDATPANDVKFYIQSVQSGNFMKGGQKDLTTDASKASLWNLEATGSAYYVSTSVDGTTYYFHMTSGGCDANTTDKDPTSWGIHQNQITFTSVNSGANAPYYRLHNGNYHAYNTSGTSISTDNNGNNTSSQWYLISTDQYNFRLTNAPKAVDDYLYADKYSVITGALREQLAEAVSATYNFVAANATIAEMEQAFDDYLAAIKTINTFESEYASKTPDTVNPVNDIDAARRALESAASSDDIAAALANIRTFDEINITQQPAATLPLHGETTVEATANNAIAYTSNDTEVITMEGNRATAIAEGSATITLTTNTSTTHYAAMPVTTTAIVVTDALILNSTTIANYSPATYGTVILERTLKAGYNSIALPFEASLTDLGAYKAYQLSVVTYNAKDGYSLYFKEVTSLTANEPYIIHLKEEKVNPTFSNVAVVAAKSVDKEATGGVDRNDVSYRKWKMVSNYAVGFNMDGKYGVVNADGCLKLGATGSTLAPFSAYIENVSDTSLPSDASTETDKQMVKALFLNGASAIEDVMNGNDALTGDPEAVYDLQGRKASAESKGVRIVIMNDGTTKKVIK